MQVDNQFCLHVQPMDRRVSLRKMIAMDFNNYTVYCFGSRNTRIEKAFSRHCRFATSNFAKMGKRSPATSSFASASKRKMPYATGTGEGRKATSWKEKQRTCVYAGLREMRAPSVRDPKTNEFYVEKLLNWVCHSVCCGNGEHLHMPQPSKSTERISEFT